MICKLIRLLPQCISKQIGGPGVLYICRMHWSDRKSAPLDLLMVHAVWIHVLSTKGLAINFRKIVPLLSNVSQNGFFELAKH